MIETCLDTLIEDLIFPDYHAAARLILVDYPLFSDSWTFYLTAMEIRCIPVIHMFCNNPHTIEYIDWAQLYYRAPFSIMLKDSHGLDGISHSRIATQCEHAKELKYYLFTNYPGLNVTPYVS